MQCLGACGLVNSSSHTDSDTNAHYRNPLVPHVQGRERVLHHDRLGHHQIFCMHDLLALLLF